MHNAFIFDLVAMGFRDSNSSMGTPLAMQTPGSKQMQLLPTCKLRLAPSKRSSTTRTTTVAATSGIALEEY